MSDSIPPICDYEGSDYQSSFWDQGDRAYEDQAEARALQRLLPSSGHLLLELGAGAGRNTPRYAGFQRVVLLDYSLTQLQQARQRLGGASRYIYVAADIYQLPFVDGLFDAATMIRTLHHMAEPERALKQVRLCLQTGAAFILEYANKRNLKAIGRYLTRKQAWSPFTIDSVEFEKLNYDFHPRAVRGWLSATGYSLEKQLSVSYFRLRFVKKLFPTKLLVTMDSWLQPTGAYCQLSPSVFTRSRAVGAMPKAGEGRFFKCPACGSHELQQGKSCVTCSTCRHEWPICDGIYDFRIMAG